VSRSFDYAMSSFFPGSFFPHRFNQFPHFFVVFQVFGTECRLSLTAG
jgi:hypothetical protein